MNDLLGFVQVNNMLGVTQVNARLKEEEAASHTGDPQFPKVQWPPQSICQSCSTVDNATGEIDWDLDNVYAFSMRYYSAKQDLGRFQRDGRQQHPALHQKVIGSWTSWIGRMGRLATIIVSGGGVMACIWIWWFNLRGVVRKKQARAA